MVSLFFNFLFWRLVCRRQLLIIFLIIIIILFFCLILSIIFNIYELLFWRKRVKKILNNQEKALEKILPLIDLGKVSLFSINSLKNSLTILRLIIDKLKDPEFIKDNKKVKEYLTKADAILLKTSRNSDVLRWQLCQEEDKRLFNLKEETLLLLKVYQDLARKHKIQIKFIIDREYRLHADCCHLLRAINILLLNSIEAQIANNGRKKTITISLEKTTYLLKIHIEDNAGGIDRELFSDLFEANCFNKDQNKGLGLGLYFANEIMKKYFLKKIKIENYKNKGTRASLIIKNSFVVAEPKLKNQEVFILGKN